MPSFFDRFLQKGDQGGRSAHDPPRRVKVAVPDDSTDLEFVSTAFQVLVAEDLKVRTASGNIETIPGEFLVAGFQYSGQLARIYATGSGAGHTQVLIWGPD